MNSKVDGRGVSSAFVPMSDRMVEGHKTAPAGNRDLTRHIDTDEWGAAMQSTEERRKIAADYLTRAKADLERASRTRIYYAFLARRYGLTNVAIGDLLGISEGAVRALIHRHGGRN